MSNLNKTMSAGNTLETAFYKAIRIEDFTKQHKSMSAAKYAGWEIKYCEITRNMEIANHKTMQVLAVNNCTLQLFEEGLNIVYSHAFRKGVKQGHKEAGKLVMGK